MAIHYMNFELNSGAEIELEIDYEQTPYIPAKTWGAIENCYPEEGGEIEINSVSQVTEENGAVPIELEERQLLLKHDLLTLLTTMNIVGGFTDQLISKIEAAYGQATGYISEYERMINQLAGEIESE